MLRIVVLATTITWANFSAANALERCKTQHEQQLVDHIFNLQRLEFDQSLNSIDWTTAIIPSADFYRALYQWHDGYNHGVVSTKLAGIKALREAIEALEKNLHTKDRIHRTLALGITKGHFARILFENEQYLLGYRTAVAARKQLTWFLTHGDSSIPGHDDAVLLQGLYEVYTADLSKVEHWFASQLAGKINHRGNRRLGVEYIETAIVGASIFSSEGLRALVAEVPWKIPDLCQYIDAISAAAQKHPNNHDFTVLHQGLLLKCGLLEEASTANDEYLESNVSNEKLRQQLTKARLRILAAYGKVRLLSSYKVAKRFTELHQLALANALDVRGQRKQALKIYQTLSNAKTQTIKRVAKARLTHPFVAPRKISTEQRLSGLPGTC